MSRVEPKMKVGSRVIWTEHLSGSSPVWKAEIIYTGTVGVIYSTYVTVIDLKMHSVEFESAEGAPAISLQVPKGRRFQPDKLKVIDDMEYKKL